MVEHLNIEEIASVSAARRLGERAGEEVTRHLAECPTCREAVDQADACLDAAASLAARDEDEAEDCPDALELAAFIEGRGDEQVGVHVLQCTTCHTVVAAARGVEPPHVVVRRQWLWNLMPGSLAVAALVALFMMSGVAHHPLSVRAHVYHDVVRGEYTHVREFDVAVTVDEPTVVHLLTLDRAGDLTVLTHAEVDDHHVFGRYRVVPEEFEHAAGAERTHAILLGAQSNLSTRLQDVDMPSILPENATQACDLLVRQLPCVCEVVPLAEPAP